MDARRPEDDYFDEKENDCVLYDRACILCGECDRCDLDPQKRCDNCGVCLEDAEGKREIPLAGVPTDDDHAGVERVHDDEWVADLPEVFEEESDAYADEEGEDDDERGDRNLPPTGIDADALAAAWRAFRAQSGWDDEDDDETE